MDFIKNALREFKHVVWPTGEETKKYFISVMAVLIAFWVYLFLVGNIFSEILFGLKNFVNPGSSSSDNIQLPEGLEWLTIPAADESAEEATDLIIDPADIPLETLEWETVAETEQ